MNGLFNEATYFNGVPESVEEILKHYDELGGPNSYGHYAAGWAVAGDTPFSWTKQVAGSYGGCRNGMVIHWPKGIKAKGEIRSQWHHVIDVAPTILEAAGLPEPKVVNSTPQTPIEGVSMLYTFADAKAKDRHKTQYFEIFGNRGIYHDGWLAHTVHRAAWESKPRRPLLEDKWELYHVEEDFSSANDLAARYPEKLEELQTLFLEEAARNQVLPLDDRTLERLNAALVGRPDLMAGRTSLTVYEGMIGMTENVFINTKNRSHTITAEVQIPKGGADGVILAQAGRFGGWSLYIKGGRPMYAYNYLGLGASKVASPKALPEGNVAIRYEFAYDGGGFGKGGTGTIFVNGEKVAAGRIDRTQGYIFSADEGADVGLDGETPVTDDYEERDNKFTGKIGKVTVDLK
jgi:arylsulfatase